MCDSRFYCLPAGCLAIVETSGRLPENHCLVAYTTVVKQVLSCRPELSNEGQWGGCLGLTLIHTNSLFLSVYLNFTKECTIIPQKGAPHHHPMSHEHLLLPSAKLLMVTWFPWGSYVNIARFPSSSYEIFSWHPPYFLLLAYTKGFQNTLKELPPHLYLGFLFMIIKPVPFIILVWGLLQRNSEVAILFTMKRYHQNDSAFYLQYSKMAAVVSTTIQSLPHTTFSLTIKRSPYVTCAPTAIKQGSWGKPEAN